MWNPTFLDVTASEIEAVGSIRVQLQQHDHRLVDVRRLARQLQDLDAVPLGSRCDSWLFREIRISAYSSTEADRSLRLD
jgi:hypothetical protein